MIWLLEGDDLVVRTEVLKLGKVGLLMLQNIYNQDDIGGQLICSAKVKLASVTKVESVDSDETYALSAMPLGLAEELQKMKPE